MKDHPTPPPAEETYDPTTPDVKVADKFTMQDASPDETESPQKPTTKKIIETRIFQGDCGSVVKMIRDVKTNAVKFAVSTGIDVPFLDWSDRNNPQFLKDPYGQPVGQQDPETGRIVPHLENFKFDVSVFEMEEVAPGWNPDYDCLKHVFDQIEAKLAEKQEEVKRNAIATMQASVANLKQQWAKQKTGGIITHASEQDVAQLASTVKQNRETLYKG